MSQLSSGVGIVVMIRIQIKELIRPDWQTKHWHYVLSYEQKVVPLAL